MATMKKLISRYPGTCRKCGQKFHAGTEIMWGGGATEHVTCPGGLTVAPPRTHTPSTPKGTNRKAGDCERCGEWLPAGQGRLVHCIEDSGCMKHHDFSGYHIYCQDTDACDERRKALREAAIKAAEEAAAKLVKERARKEADSAAYRETKDRLVAEHGLVRMSCGLPDGISLGESAEVGRDNSGFYRLTLTQAVFNGRVALREDVNGHDDWRTYWWVPADVARAARLTFASKNGITADKARDWLSKYRGCDGQDVYEEVIADDVFGFIVE